MTRYVYLLNDYGEHGPENQVATLDRAYIRDMLKSFWPDADVTPELSSLDEFMSFEDTDIVGVHNLSKGWGGLQFSVLALAELLQE